MGIGRGATAGWTAAALLLMPMPAAGQEPAALDCAAIVAERTLIAEELHATREEIGDIAMGRKPRKNRKVSGGAAARGAAQTAAGILLPFPFGILVGAGAAATKDRKGKPLPAGPDVPALIERQQLLEKKQAELAAIPCG